MTGNKLNRLRRLQARRPLLDKHSTISSIVRDLVAITLDQEKRIAEIGQHIAPATTVVHKDPKILIVPFPPNISPEDHIISWASGTADTASAAGYKYIKTSERAWNVLCSQLIPTARRHGDSLYFRDVIFIRGSL